ncbi:MAG: sodium-translocating pyrophosphatase [Bacillota bacterium]
MSIEAIQRFFVVVPIGSAIALAYAAYLAFSIMKREEGSKEMVRIASAIRQGARAYLRRQYYGVGLFFAVMFVILLLLAWRGYLSVFTPFAFLTGGFFSGLAGFIGMTVATNSNARTAYAAKQSLNSALTVAFSSGTVMGLVVVGLGLLDLSVWYFLLDWYYRDLELAQRITNITSTMLTFGMGASSMALFARVGGGIYTKAADVGADLVGKVEASIPEDDPRNPAVIADNVGDNVGDVAGMGADLYESYVGSIIATVALAVAASRGSVREMVGRMLLPMAMAALGVLASIIGTFMVKLTDNESDDCLLGALRRGTYISAGLIAVVGFFLISFVLGWDNIGVYGAVLAGLLAGIIIGVTTEYYTSAQYSPTKKLASASETGPATVIINGLSLGMGSTVLPVVTVGTAVLASYFLAGGGSDVSKGLYGIAISAVGMLSTLGITLATDAYGPVADNAGGIAEMTNQPPQVRQRTDALDALGNTTAATGKGFAIGSAALTALALIAAYKDQVDLIIQKTSSAIKIDLSLLNPPVLVGVFVGAALPFMFSSMTISAVGRAAQSIVFEVRRQFREIKGLMDGKASPDYAACVDICVRSAQREMIAPTLAGIVVPIVVGLVLGVNGVAGLLAGATVTGFILAVLMANAGGSWDNAKKYVESGEFGGTGSDCHKATVVGDTVGDPLKDTAGPSINILIKLLSMVSIVFASLVVQNSLL